MIPKGRHLKRQNYGDYKKFSSCQLLDWEGQSENTEF